MDLRNDSAVVSKICGMFIFILSALIFGLLPMIIHAHVERKVNTQFGRKYKQLLSFMTAFGGGVLLSTTFLHLLPEIRESTESLREKHFFSYNKSLQLPELLMCLGFLLLYLLEEVAEKFVGGKHKVAVQKLDLKTFVRNECTEPVLSPSSITEQNISEEIQSCEANNRSHENCEKEAMDKLKNDTSLLNNDNNQRHCQNGGTIFLTESSGRNFLLISALSIHEAFEGLAIGLERHTEAVWYMVLAVSTHKAIIALCISIQMLSTKLNRKIAIIYVFVFATATPFGVLLGLLLYMESGIFSVVLQGLASGTLLHVVFFELLKPHSNGTPFSGVFLGFVCMAVLKFFSP